MAIHWKIIIGLVLGILWAFGSSYLGWSQFTLDWIAPFGTIFINLLKMIAVPLVLFSIIKGVADLQDITKLGKTGIKTLGIYLVTTLFAVSLGLGLVNILKPGAYLEDEQLIKNRIEYELWCAETNTEIKDGKNYLSDSQYSQYIAEAKASYKEKSEAFSNDASMQKKAAEVSKTKKSGPLQALVDIVPSNIFVSLTNNKLMLQVIFFGVFFGVSLLLIPAESAKPVNAVIGGLNDVFLMMVDVIMKAAPFFVFALLAGKFSELAKDDPSKLFELFATLGVYSLVVALGLALMIFVVYPFVLKLVVRKKITYGSFFKRISPAQFLAFSTSSSAATLPVTIECVRDRVGVSKEVTSFVLPIGATVNMDGTSLYQAVAAIFLAQIHLIDLSFGQQMTIVLTATLASIGSAAVPSAGLVMLMIVLGSVGLNPAWVAFIIPIDRLLDMMRTVVNVTGDATVATVVASTENELHVVDDSELDDMYNEELDL
ncbi:MAG: dicarboxylate/amino acid:cation symporter [Flavobacteriales bacterium]|jgi:Na+/H+-dicarboxylate symporter|nr:dicarboxylate/amino acid:cation symporter [Flavobacteriales bacterium]